MLNKPDVCSAPRGCTPRCPSFFLCRLNFLFLIETRAVLQDGAPLDVLLLPGLGFDTSGNRLGRGGGYYDKALERLMQRAQDLGREPPLLVGLAYSCQVVPEVPVDKHDKKVDVLVTAAGVITFTNKSAGN
uniref:5-formyltetrahydrofolate cyclo-ligase n=1 Tax=Dunaliella tertiolecta TaxID=3047 RepID=A0A7S3QMQ1_DUNTE